MTPDENEAMARLNRLVSNLQKGILVTVALNIIADYIVKLQKENIEKDVKQHLFREKLAELCHKQWSDWTKYFFSKCNFNFSAIPEGAALIPNWAIARWRRQIKTDYKDLSEDEKESDRKEANKFIELMLNNDN